MRYFIEMQFHGKNYHGWQVQPNTKTVQGELNEKLGLLLKHSINTIGAGRTDTGVHAKHFIAHFDYPDNLTPQLKIIQKKLNQFLSNDIVVNRIILMHDTAHSRFDAISRTYKYYITRTKNVFEQEFAWPLYYDLNMSSLNEASHIISATTDFTAFSKLHTDNKTNLCRILHCNWNETGNMLVFTVTADRFLRNMVRALVGTLIDVGRGKVSCSELKQIIESKNRSDAGESAPAKGLFLYKIEYPYAF